MNVFKGIDTQVYIPEKEDGKDAAFLTIKCYFNENVVEFYLDNELIFTTDWDGNLKDIVEEMQEAFEK